MNTAADAFLLVYAGLFPIVNPLGNAPIFLALTANHSDAVRRMLAGRVAVNGFFLLLGSLFVGSHVLVFFGITVPVLRIAGGLVVAAFGWSVLRDGAGSTHDAGPARGLGRGVLPADPAADSRARVNPRRARLATPDRLRRFRPVLRAGTGAIVGLATIVLTTFLCYRFAGAWLR
jgi:multiple antibiotic resistance protein